MFVNIVSNSHILDSGVQKSKPTKSTRYHTLPTLGYYFSKMGTIQRCGTRKWGTISRRKINPDLMPLLPLYSCLDSTNINACIVAFWSLSVNFLVCQGFLWAESSQTALVLLQHPAGTRLPPYLRLVHQISWTFSPVRLTDWVCSCFLGRIQETG